MLRMPPSIWHYRNSRKLVQIYLALREFGNWVILEHQPQVLTEDAYLQINNGKENKQNRLKQWL